MHTSATRPPCFIAAILCATQGTLRGRSGGTKDLGNRESGIGNRESGDRSILISIDPVRLLRFLLGKTRDSSEGFSFWIMPPFVHSFISFIHFIHSFIGKRGKATLSIASVCDHHLHEDG
eukprot:scaffold14_cov279-Pinguiococcus_pyrenoidosus.AAC.5